MKIKIAVVQFEIKQYLPTLNLIKAEKFIRKASKKKVDVIVFPEDFVTGPIAGDKNFVDFEGKYKEIFRVWAISYKIDIVAGSFIEGEANKWFNTSYYFDSKGHIKTKYRKINLWHPEKRYLKKGETISVFQTKYGKAGIIICWDMFFPEIFREMINKGVKIIYCPSYWSVEDANVGLKYNKKSEIELVNNISVARAFENEVVFVYSNAAGKYNIKGYAGNLIGRSQITLPFLGAIKRLNHNKEKMFLQEVNTDILNDAEVSYKVRRWLKNR